MNLLRSFVKLSSLGLLIALILMTGCGSPATITKTTIVLNSISITPTNPSIAVNATEQFVATGNFSDGSTANLSSSVTWASSNQADAAMNGTGVATGMAAGSTTITASTSGVTGSTTLTVTAAAVTVTSIAVSPTFSQHHRGCNPAVHCHRDLQQRHYGHAHFGRYLDLVECASGCHG